MAKSSNKALTHLRRIQLLAFLTGFPGLAATLVLLFHGGYSPKVYLTVLVLACSAWLYFAIRLQYRIIHPLQTASNMLSALREGDFSLQASYSHGEDPLGQLMLEINLLTQVLSEHRISAMEAHKLLDKVMDEIDAAVFTFDPNRKINLANQAAHNLLRKPKSDLQGKYAGELNLDSALDSPPNAIIPNPDTGLPGKYTVRRGTFRVNGEPYQLLILIDVSKSLREEELHAWKRLIRVLGHEINNSMAPIMSISDSLRSQAKRVSIEDEAWDDVIDGLEIISQRANSLTRFVREYATLAKLPPPCKSSVQIGHLIQRAAKLCDGNRIHIMADCRQDIVIQADPDQLEQALINLCKNAVEATQQTRGDVKISWQLRGDLFFLYIDDSGTGIANPNNLFIPFFSTKQDGSGIGLTLSRQIIESHDGSLELANRTDQQGCRATIILPAS